MRRRKSRIMARLEDLTQAAQQAVGHAAQQAVGHAAEEAAGAACELAPVDSGELRRSISVRQISPLETAVVAAAPHAAMVEFGTSRSAAQPFMLPAAQMQRARLSQHMQKACARAKGGKA